MHFGYSREQEEFRAALRKLIADRAPLSTVRARLGDSHDAGLWRVLCDDMALPALAAPEAYGGAGFSLIDTSVALSELGGALAPVPALESVLAIEAVLRFGTESQKQQLLPDLCSGKRIAVVAIAGRENQGVGPRSVMVTTKRKDGAVLTGSQPHVLRGHIADLLIIPASSPEGVHLYLVDRSSSGVTVRGRERAFDLTRPVSRVDLRGVEATRLGNGSPAELDALTDIARTLLAAEMVGAAQACLDMSVQYARYRVQFNRAIGSFQAIKHGCARRAVEIDAAEAAMTWATMLAANGDADLRIAAPLASAQAADTFTACAGWNIQVHGGIGFTWEHDAHLYLRRAKADEVLFGTSADLRLMLADRIGI